MFRQKSFGFFIGGKDLVLVFFAGALAHNITMPLQDYLLPRKADIAALVRTEVLCTHSIKGQTDFIAASVKNNQE